MYIISVIALRKKKKEIAKNQYQLVIGKKKSEKRKYYSRCISTAMVTTDLSAHGCSTS